MSKEMVSHPSHYNQVGRKECIVEMEEFYGAEFTAIFCLMSAYKYLYRKGNKDDNSIEQDTKKAEWYFDYVRNNLYNEMTVEFIESSSFRHLYHEILALILEEDE